jgi:hypothetical protein
MSIIPQDNRITSFVIDRTHDYIMYDTTDLVRAIDFPRQVAGLLLKDDEFHSSLFAVREEYGFDEAGYGRLEQVSCQAGAAITTEPELTGDFLKLKDDTTDRETIIALAQWDELETWRDAIRELIPQAEFIIPHITLYTNQKGALGYSDRHRDRVRVLDDAVVMTLRNILLRSKL